MATYANSNSVITYSRSKAYAFVLNILVLTHFRPLYTLIFSIVYCSITFSALIPCMSTLEFIGKTK
jgi:hypothetical protein